MKLWPLLAAVGAALVLTKDQAAPAERKREKRAQLLALARAELGNTDPAPYWVEVAGPDPRYWSEHWCGAFALAMLRRAGIAPESWRWVTGHGFILRAPMRQLGPRELPQPGDIAYFTANQHHAIVESVDAAARTMTTIDGNSTGGAVARNPRALGSAHSFHSIEALL